MGYITGKAQNPVLRFLKILSIILIIAGIAGAYLYQHPEIWQKWVKGTPLEPPPTVTRLYKWRDSDGQWQVTDRLPAADVEYEILRYRSDTNLMPSLPDEEE